MPAFYHLSVLANTARFPISAAPATPMVEVTGRDSFVYAPAARFLEGNRKLVEEVSEGEPAGCIQFVDNPAREPGTVTFRRNGLLVCKRHLARIDVRQSGCLLRGIAVSILFEENPALFAALNVEASRCSGETDYW